MKLKPFFLFLTSVLLSCNNENTVTDQSYLSSWNDGNTKDNIVNFVKDVTNPDSEYFVEEKDRIAVFDNDGNLWTEQPMYFQFIFAMDVIRDMAEEHPEWKDDELLNAVINGDDKKVLSFGEKGLVQILLQSHAGITNEEFGKKVKHWLKEAKHPRFNRPYTDLVYLPMLELLEYLRENKFKIFIVSGGGIEFMRVWAEDIYKIPKENIIGSSLEYEFNPETNKIERLPGVWFNNDKEGKVIGISRYIGKKPILCSGNSDGDLAMMQFTNSGEGRRLLLYLHHTDSVREYAYDKFSHVGKLDRGLNLAQENGWTVIDMEKDWKRIYSFEDEK